MKKPMGAILSHNLRQARRRRGVTQAALAEAAGLATEAYGRLERGLAIPRADTLQDLARALEVPVAELLASPGERQEGTSSAAGRRELRAAEEPLPYRGRSAPLERIVRELEAWPLPLLRLLATLLEAARKQGLPRSTDAAARVASGTHAAAPGPAAKRTPRDSSRRRGAGR